MALKDELLLALLEKVDTSSQNTLLNDVVAVWHRLLGKFSPLIGPSSVAVLFVRCLDANRAAFPWLPRTPANGAAEMQFTAFEALLKTRPSDEVIRVTHALLGSYIDLLFTLIGTPLTAHFVGAAVGVNGDKKK